MPLFTPGEMSKGGKSISLSLIPKCGVCKLNISGCQTPKMKYSGKGKRGILILGEAPGENEDRVGRPFVGKAGQVLRDVCRELDVNLEHDCWLYNAAICRPPDNDLPIAAIDHCRPNVLNRIRELKPSTIILLGTAAVKSLVGHLWREDPGGVMRWAGYQIPAIDPNCWVCPTYHPSFVDRAKTPVERMMFKKHLKAAFELEGRPWSEMPDYEKRVRIIYDDQEAATAVQKIHKAGLPTAFDFETNMIKPDSKGAKIACCSLSNGVDTIAYLWRKDARKATCALLESEVPKIGYNLKFELRWIMRKFGKPVRNFIYDGMIDSHIIDYRTAVSSLKFQAFAMFGTDDYAGLIKEYLTSSEGGNSENRVFEAPPRDLLMYCGIDSYLEWRVWKDRNKEKG